MWNKKSKSGFTLKRFTNQGFTLIELLVSVGLVAVLTAGIVSVTGQGSRQFARDSRRQTDIQNVASALAMYRNDQTFYPNCPGGVSSCLLSTVVGLTPNYIQTLPPDPVAGNRIYRYRPMTSTGVACTNAVGSRCARFTLCAGSEKDTTTNNDVACGSATCGDATQHCVYTVNNP